MTTPTDSELNRAAAEFAGWTGIEDILGYWRGESPHGMIQPLPNYLTGFEALGNAHELEKILTNEQYANGFNNTFIANLWDIMEKDDPKNKYLRLVSATAPQRIRALLRVVRPELFR